jgi:hypothetical protein
MALTKITTNVIEDNAITADKIDTSSLTAAGFATESYVTTAVANLVDSVSGTLDTLNELEAALGDDPNFATTITNSIGTKAPIDDATFTGTTTIPTADINAGTIDDTVIGGTTAAAGSFTNITVSGTVDGRDIASDGSKLDGIESDATADQTAEEIRTLVGNATDSNVFTDADHSKLDGIEALADVTDTTNVEAAGALMDSELTDITAIKALNQG